MSRSTTISERVLVLCQLADWWRRRRHSRTAMDERNCCGLVSEGMARETGVSNPERRVLAGKWPDSAGRLNRQMEQLMCQASLRRDLR